MTATEQQNETIIIDATDRPIGRLASEVAERVRGKDQPSFLHHQLPKVRVIIENIKHVKISNKKLTENRIWRHSGYPGGMKSKSWNELYQKGPDVLFMHVIKNMIPKNKLSKEVLKRISFK